jgi:hypothetical protein
MQPVLPLDPQLDPSGLIDLPVGGLFALENPRDVESSTAIAVWNVAAIAHQPALRDKFTVGVDRWDSGTRRQRDDLLPPAGKEVRDPLNHLQVAQQLAARARRHRCQAWLLRPTASAALKEGDAER